MGPGTLSAQSNYLHTYCLPSHCCGHTRCGCSCTGQELSPRRGSYHCFLCRIDLAPKNLPCQGKTCLASGRLLWLTKSLRGPSTVEETSSSLLPCTCGKAALWQNLCRRSFRLAELCTSRSADQPFARESGNSQSKRRSGIRSHSNSACRKS